jgi:antitoxin ParD1/3/4
MSNSNLPVSEGFEESLKEAAVAAGYPDIVSYLEALVKADRKKRALERLEAMALEALDSGPSYELTDEVWERIDAEFKKRINERRASASN